MIKKTLLRKVNHESYDDQSSRRYSILDEEANIITRFDNIKAQKLQIFTYDRESESYKQFSFSMHQQVKVSCTILVNNYLLIFHDQYLKLAILDIVKQSIEINQNAMPPYCYYYCSDVQIYQLKERVMKVYDYSQYPQIQEFKFQNYIDKIEIIALLAQSLMKVTQQGCKTYYLLPLQQGQTAVDIHHPQIRLMHLRYFRYCGAKDKIITVKSDNYVISKRRRSRYLFNGYFFQEVKAFNKFLYFEQNDQHIQIFQMHPKQKIIRMLVKGIINNSFKLIKDQYIIGRLPQPPCNHYVQDITTAKYSTFDSTDDYLFTDRIFMDIKSNKLKISSYEITSEQ